MDSSDLLVGKDSLKVASVASELDSSDLLVGKGSLKVASVASELDSSALLVGKVSLKIASVASEIQEYKKSQKWSKLMNLLTKCQENHQNKLSLDNGKTYKNRTTMNNTFKNPKNPKHGPK